VKIYSPFKLPEYEPTCEGSKYRKQYKKTYNTKGSPVLTEVGKIDIQEQINSNRCASVNDLVGRYLAGDESALTVRTDAVYADVSNVPSLGEMVNISTGAQAAIAALEQAEAAAANVTTEENTNAES